MQLQGVLQNANIICDVVV